MEETPINHINSKILYFQVPHKAQRQSQSTKHLVSHSNDKKGKFLWDGHEGRVQQPIIACTVSKGWTELWIGEIPRDIPHTAERKLMLCVIVYFQIHYYK